MTHQQSARTTQFLDTIAAGRSSEFSPSNYPTNYAVDFVQSMGNQFLPTRYHYTPNDPYNYDEQPSYSDAWRVIRSYAFEEKVDEDVMLVDIAEAALAYYGIEAPESRFDTE